MLCKGPKKLFALNSPHLTTFNFRCSSNPILVISNKSDPVQFCKCPPEGTKTYSTYKRRLIFYNEYKVIKTTSTYSDGMLVMTNVLIG